MKKLRIFLPVIIALLLLTLTSCDLSQDADFSTEQETASYYFENKNGELNSQKWISFSVEKWKYYDGSEGSFVKNGSEAILKKDGSIWAAGSFKDGVFELIKDGKTILYYAVGSNIPQVFNAFTMRTVYEKAVDLGFEGTLEELIAMFRGDVGKSAYDLAVEHGYRGNEAQWLASLAGSAGETPMIGANGHWFVGDTDTGIAATGTGIKKVELTATEGNVDTYTITMTDGSRYDFTVTNGLSGAAGEKGAGIRKIEKTATDGQVDTYTVSLTDDTSYTFTVTNGKDGKDGKDGKNGVDGADATRQTLREIYEEAVEAGYTGTYLDFLGEYAYAAESESAKINASCFSVVSIICTYDVEHLINGRTQTDQGGSGVIYSMNKEAGDAYILTNYHVVYSASRLNEENVVEPGICDRILVYLFGSEAIGDETGYDIGFVGMGIEAEYIGGSMNYDLALLKITGSDILKNSNARAINFADSEQVSVGDTVYPVGNSGGDGIAVTKGIVNYPSERIVVTAPDGETRVSFRVIRCDGAINPGNSGGPLMNANGELVGIVNVKIVNTQYDNVGYAIPSNVVKNVVDNIFYYYEKTGETPVSVKKLLIGIMFSTSEAHAEYDEATGTVTRYENTFVSEVSAGSLADGQIKKGDVITKATVERNGVSTEYVLTRPYILTDLMLTIRAGDKVTLEYKRDADGTETIGEAVINVTEENLTVAK